MNKHALDSSTKLKENDCIQLLSDYLVKGFYQDIPQIEVLNFDCKELRASFSMKEYFMPAEGVFHLSGFTFKLTLYQICLAFASACYGKAAAESIELIEFDCNFKKMIHKTKDIQLSMKLLPQDDRANIHTFAFEIENRSFFGKISLLIPHQQPGVEQFILDEKAVSQHLPAYCKNLLQAMAYEPTDYQFSADRGSCHVKYLLDTQEPKRALAQLFLLRVAAMSQLTIVYGGWRLDYASKPGPFYVTNMHLTIKSTYQMVKEEKLIISVKEICETRGCPVLVVEIKNEAQDLICEGRVFIQLNTFKTDGKLDKQT